MARKILIATLVVLALLAAAAVVLRRLVDPEAVRAAVEQQATAALGQPVRVGAVDWAFSARPRVVFTDVQIGSPAAITLRRVELATGLRALLSKRVEGAGIVLSGSRIQLPLPFTLGGAGQADAQADGGIAAAFTIASIDRISLEDIELLVGDRHLRLDAESSLSGDRLAVSRLRLRSDATSVDGRGEVSSLTARAGAFTATADPLDLDELLTIATGLSGSTPGGATLDGTREKGAPLDVRLQVEAARGRVLGIAFTGLAATLALTRDAVTLDPLGVSLFGGGLKGRVRVDSPAGPPRLSVSASLASMDVAQLAAFAGSGGVITGRLDGQIDLHADAGLPETVFRTAAGRAALTVADGTIPGLDLVGPVILVFGKPDASKAVPRSDAFSRLGGTFALANGVLRSDDLAMASRDVDLKGGGTLRVAGAAVDLKADLILSEDLSSQAGRDLYRYAREGTRVVLPATITGSLASPKVSIDLGAAAGRALRNTVEDEIKKGLGRLFKP
jgi:AsmA protein